MIRQITERFTPRQYLAEFLLGLTALFGLYLIVAWSSYTPLDNSWATAGVKDETINKMGALGAWIIDLLFVLLGYVAHVVPFLVFLVPVYLLKTKAVKHLSCTRIILRSFGFVTLVIGVCIIFALSISSNVYYLSGGILGGSIVVNLLYPLLGKFGTILIGIFLSVVGFIFCSGASFIRLIVNFYYWLTMKNEAPETVSQSHSQDQQVTPNSINTVQENVLSPIETQADSVENFVSQEQVSVVQSDVPSPLVSPETLINISGLTPTVAMKSEYESQENGGNMHSFGSIHSESEELPSVHISPNSSVSVPTKNDFIPVWVRPVKKPDNDIVQNVISEELPEVSLPKDVNLPSVSLPGSSESITENENEGPDFEALAKEFAEYEAHQISRADDKVKEIEDQFTITIPDASRLENNTESRKFHQTLSQDDMGMMFDDEIKVDLSNTKPNTPNYKGYDGSLIHPVFQQPITKKEKPSTPLPSLDLLAMHPAQEQNVTEEEIIETSHRIEQQLRNFNVKATVKDVLVGPVVTRYELELQPGVKASKVTGIDTDLARALMFRSIRVAEVIPGKPYIGIETPNAHRQIVPLRDVLDSKEFRESKDILPMALGKDISGKAVVVDLVKMPHLLVAGSTGSGKSVGVNTMILSLLFRVQPEDVKFIMIDPKVVELSVYNDIPHLLTPVVTDMKKAANALRWCVDEMERRYQLLSALRVRNIEGFNAKIEEYDALNMPIPDPLWRPGDSMDTMPPALEKLSYIVVIVDEFAELMMVAGKQIEELIARLAQKARAVGIHLILATQRPSVDVITGLIKANVPSRIAFTVAGKIDSRTILDQSGAEALLGRGDMLYSGQGSSDLVRIHGAFMSDEEVVRVADDWRARGKPDYIDGILENSEEEESNEKSSSGGGELDPLFDEVVSFVINTGTTSVSSIQRKFSVGFNRAARIMDQMEEQGIVSSMQNGKREILAQRPEY